MKTASLITLILLFLSCNKDKENGENLGINLQLYGIHIGDIELSFTNETSNCPTDKPIILKFANELNISTVEKNISLSDDEDKLIDIDYSFQDNNKTVLVQPVNTLSQNTEYRILINDDLKSTNGNTFKKLTVSFFTINPPLTITQININGEKVNKSDRIKDISFNPVIEINFSEKISNNDLQEHTSVTLGSLTYNFTTSQKNDTTVSFAVTDKLPYYRKITLSISSELSNTIEKDFEEFDLQFYTQLDSTLKFTEVSDNNLLTLVQQQTFKYFWDFAHPVSGMARERNTSGEIVTSGGSGFGIMAIIVGIERGFISRTDGIARLKTILTFLETCERFHGAWSHWINGTTGKTIPFSTKDNGADLVETSYVIQGLYTFRQYLNNANSEENDLISRINSLIDSVEYDWFTQSGQEVLYWHWSPDYAWEMNHQIRGYNETLITYIVAAASTTHTISADVYHKGYARNGDIVNGNTYFGYKLPLGNNYGGPLFFTHYSFLGLDPRNLSDNYANYWEQNVNQSLINQAYCDTNKLNYVGYSDACWGLTASDNHKGYSAHSPSNDLGVVTPTGALSSIPYCPEQSLKALHHFYYMLGDRLWGEYGFYDAFNITENWWADSYLAIDQGPIIIMIENYRTGLLWDLFMSCPEIKAGLTKLEFSYE